MLRRKERRILPPPRDLLTDKTAQRRGATEGTRMAMVTMAAGAHVHPPGQHVAQRGDVGGAEGRARAPRRGRRVGGQVAQAAAALRRRARLVGGGPGEGGAGAANLD